MVKVPKNNNNIKFIPRCNLSKLKQYSDNPKVNDKTIDALSLSLNRFGAIAPIICNEKFVICDGHARYDAAIERGDKTFPVIIAPQLIGNDFKAYNIASTQTARLSDWDTPVLAEIIKSLSDSGYEVDALGFDGNELEDILNSLDDGAGGTKGLTDPDDVPDPPKKPITKPGDLWQLGRHRLLCGDATKAEDVERLMDGDKANMVFTDPPYGVNIVGPKGNIGGENICKPGNYRRIIGDDKPFNPSQLLKMADDQIIFGGNYFSDKLPPTPCWLVWDKRDNIKSNNFADCEIAWTSFKSPSRIYKCLWMGMIKEGEHEKRYHPTQKPIKLFTDIMNDYSKDSMIDPYVGSGTTIISCEQTGRTCYAMEIDPIYCDVSIKRWENFTGLKAERIK